MTITHPYGYPFAIFMLAGALFFLVGTWAYIDDLIERKRQRHLDDVARAEHKLANYHAMQAAKGHIPPQRSS